MGLNGKNRDQRIGIIGAGVSGLTAAHHLQHAGYQDVTVLEQEERSGGKCCSVAVDSRVYELGAVLGNQHYTETLAMMAATGAQPGPVADVHFYTLDGHSADPYPWYRLPSRLWQLLAHYLWARELRFRKVNHAGLAGLPPELARPFSEFAQQHGLAEVQRALSPFFTGFGYGWFDEVPAAYVLKYFDVPMIEAYYFTGRRISWPDGAQAVWSRLAEQLDVRTGTTVERVTRSDTVRVQTDHGEWEFDTLIVTSPLDQALHFLDARPAERRLFSMIRHYDYRVLLCRISDLPGGNGGLPENFFAKRYGHPLLWHRPRPDDPLCSVYVLADGIMSDAEVERICAADFAGMGARLEQVVQARRWHYFPHVDSDAMAGGFYEDLEALQGSNHTYYAGEVMTFATIEHCARYSRRLVERFFAGSADRGAAAA
jgi:hypothetical protein